MRTYIIIGFLLTGIAGLLGVILYPTFEGDISYYGSVRDSTTPKILTLEEKYQAEVQEMEVIKKRESALFNLAQKKDDITLCGNITDTTLATDCRDQFIIRKAVTTNNPATCETLTGALVIQRCEDEVYYTLSLSVGDSKLCTRINDAVRKSTCLEEVSQILYRDMTASGTLTETSCDTLVGEANESCAREFQKQKDGRIYELATKTQDITLCKNIYGEEIRTLCQNTIRLKLALTEGNSTLCNSITDEKKRATCEKQLARTNMITLYQAVVESANTELCVKIPDEKLAHQCHDTIVLGKIRATQDTTLCRTLFATGSITACQNMVSGTVSTSSTGALSGPSSSPNTFPLFPQVSSSAMPLLPFLISSVLFLIGIFWSTVGNAAFEPAPMISMTGSVEGSVMVGVVRFDVSPYTEDFETLNPRLDTTIKTFTGGFYTDGVGWFVFQYGADKVTLNCGLQPLENLTSKCTLTGTGWGENVGYLQFGTASGVVEYLPDLGVLSGSAWNQGVGSVKLDGIYLPLRKAMLKDMDRLIASDSTTLSISGAEGYGYTVDGWEIEFAPTNASIYSQFLTSADGIFEGADTTIAGRYTYTIKDPSGSITTDTPPMQVFPGKMSKSLYVATPTNLAYYCTNELAPLVSICPDGKANLKSTYFSGGLSIPPKKTIAQSDGVDNLDLEIALRDTYGNAIMSDGTTTLKLRVNTTNTVKRCQILNGIFSENENICKTVDDIISSPIKYNNGLILNIENWITLGSNPTLSITSIAPTNTGNILTLDSIDYSFLSGALEIHSGSILSLPIKTNFKPLYSISGLTIDSLSVGSPTTIDGEVVQEPTPVLLTNPHIIHGLSIGSGPFANSSFHFEPVDVWACSAFVGESTYTGYCDWETALSGDFSPTVGDEPMVVGDFTKKWNLVSLLPSLTETAWFTPVYTYAIGGETIAYYGDTVDLDTTELTIPPKVLFTGNMGKTQNSSYTGASISTSNEGIAGTLNLLRKNATLLSRSRTSYADVDYTVFNNGGDVTVDRALMTGKRAIIVVGRDVIIRESLTGSNLSPRAIIALSDAVGNGGNIIIESGVRDIYASLYSDRALISGTKAGGIISPYGDAERKNQLYIRGSVVTQNTVGGGRCPALIESCTLPTASLYDLERFRSEYHQLSAIERPLHISESPAALAYPGSSVIIDYEPATLQDPPPGLRTERQ